MGGTILRVFTSNFPINVMLGTKFLWCVLSIPPENVISNPGIRVNTEKMLKNIAFISTVPRSRPSLNCISIIATIPETVVRQLDDISGIALLSAVITASRGSIRRRSSV